MTQFSSIFAVPCPQERMVQRAVRGVVDFARERWPWRHRLNIDDKRVDELVQRHEASWWHAYAIHKRHWRRHVCLACGWIADHAPRSAKVFEPGCGGGANLLWLAQQGFTNLSGADIDGDALRLCTALQGEMACSFPVWEDNCLEPAKLPQEQDIILSVNWLYHVPGSSLDDFLRRYTPCLSSRGGFVLDVVDSAYNAVKDNAYHTSDKNKAIEQRRPSEYTFRMSVSEVAATAASHGLRVARQASAWSKPQRRVFMLVRGA